MTSNKQLLDMAKKLDIPNFRGVYMKDELKLMKPQFLEAMIINTERSDQTGKHWLGIYKVGDKKYFYDSFGAPVLDEIKEYLGSRILCTNFQSQHFSDNTCGELCILFLYLMSKGLKYEDIILNMVEESN